MSYANFIPNVWNEAINRNLDRSCVFAEDCNREYEGNIKSKGESVTILGIGKIAVNTLSNRDDQIDAAVSVEDVSSIMYINQIKYQHFKVNDIDKAQAIPGLMDAITKESAEAYANAIDKYLAGMAVDSSVSTLTTNATKIISGTTSGTSVNVLEAVDLALQKLYENDVSPSTELVLTVPPRFYTLFKRAYIGVDTNNSTMLREGAVSGNGRVATYGNVTIKMSNNVHVTSETVSGSTYNVDNIMLRTKRAIAYCKPLTHTEAYRPDRYFEDAIKSFILFDAKVIRPFEVINLNVKYA